MNKLLVLALFAACGGGDDSSDSTTKIDAAKIGDAAKTADGSVTVDAAPATVQTVDCASATPAASVMTSNFMFVPATATITVGSVVKFTLESEHDIVPDTSTNTDSGLVVNFGATACLKFTAKGTFGYKCAPHGFKGSVTVN